MCMLYEGLLLFGLLFFVTWIVLLSTKHCSATTQQMIKQVTLFLVIGGYFIYSWCRGNGQTLPMKTWRIQLVGADYRPLRWQHAVIRYLLAWMWFLPAIVVSYILGLKPVPTFTAIGIGMVVWALTIFLDRERQFLHDKLAGTRLIQLPSAKPSRHESDATTSV